MKPIEKVKLAREYLQEFTIQYPPRREYFQDHFRTQVDATECGAAKRILLYCHVPFCKAKCYYCNFAVDVRPDSGLHRKYVDMLLREIASADKLLASAEIPGIDIGGGTPTILPTEQLVRILTALKPFKARSKSTMPLSIETTPFIAAKEKDKLSAMRENGVDRISMGLQSTNVETLASVNRGDQQELGLTALSNLKNSRFKRVSVDLIFGLPEQTDEHWQTDLERVVSLKPDTITTYDCLYRGKGRALTKRKPNMPSAERYGELYKQAYSFLTESGYHAPYGSVNFSLHKGETGTSAYFEGRLLDGLPYLGLGNYASSLYGNNWWFAPYGVNQWLSRVEAGESFPIGPDMAYSLPDSELMAKYLLLSLSFGIIDCARYQSVYGKDIHELYDAELACAVEQGWLRKEGVVYYICNGQFANLPQLRALFYSTAAIKWLKARK